MSDQISVTGHCMCGEVSIEANLINNEVGVCHCKDCRRWSGSPFMSVESYADDVVINGQELVAIYNSSDWAERGFCSKCGSNLFYRLKENQKYFLLAGLFEQEDEFAMDHQIFIDRKPDFYSFANKTKNLTAEETIAMFSSD